MIWFISIPAWLIVNFLAYILAPVLALLAFDQMGACDNAHTQAVEPRLPKFLAWFQTPDNSLLGDEAWKKMEPGHWEWRAKYTGWRQVYLGRLGWLLRNPAYGFEASMISGMILSTDPVSFYGNPLIQDKPQGKAGYCYTTVGNYWNAMAVIRIAPARCIKFNFGWKLKTYAEKPERVQTEPVAKFVFSLTFPSFISGAN